MKDADHHVDPEEPVIAVTREYCVDVLVQVKKSEAPYVVDGTCVPVGSTMANQCSEYFNGWTAVLDDLCENAIHENGLIGGGSNYDMTGGSDTDKYEMDADPLFTDPEIVDGFEEEDEE